ncbi:MAG: 4Fe-4S dicluster domain-containing protein [Candidatus Omnitrophica bacterium]|nr:4Fe-4S dicluster domain-containing protein [Candidatus Omnitrophota bacterium]
MEKLSRREFLNQLVSMGLVAFFPFLLRERQISGLIRPPGSVFESLFNKLCFRCGVCFKTCPAHCLWPVPLDLGLNSWGSPYIIPRKAGCLRCGACGRACPSAAIRPVPTEQVKMGTAKINPALCLVWQSGKECLVCLEYCPVGAVILDEKGRPSVEPSLCVGCGLCEENCPVTGSVAAITVSTKGEKRYYPKENKYR